MENTYKTILSILKCPTCEDFLLPPIKLCETGHSHCRKCRVILPICTLCTRRFTDTSNLALETLANTLDFPCKNQPFGCRSKLSLANKPEHEANCNFGAYKCPTCNWKGKYSEIAPHWATKNLSPKWFGTHNHGQINLDTNGTHIQLIKFYRELFWFKCKNVSGDLALVVQHIKDMSKDDDAEAGQKNFMFEVSFCKPDQGKCIFTIADDCCSLDINETELFSEKYAIVLPSKSVIKFTDDDMVLNYQLKMIDKPKEPINVLSAASSIAEGLNKLMELDLRHVKIQKPNVKQPNDKKPDEKVKPSYLFKI